MTGLGLEESAEDYSWVPDYRASCGKCIRACPVKAIYEKPHPSEFGQASSTDGDICLPYFHTHFGCSMCVGVCPFTRGDYHTIKKAWLKRGGRSGAPCVRGGKGVPLESLSSSGSRSSACPRRARSPHRRCSSRRQATSPAGTAGNHPVPRFLFDTGARLGDHGGMRTRLLSLLLICIGSALASAQVEPRVVVINYSDKSVDVRIGEDADPALGLNGLAPRIVTPLLTCKKTGKFSVYVHDQSAPQWVAIEESIGEGVRGGPKLFNLAAGRLYAIGVVAEDGAIGAFLQELTLPAGKGPKVLFTASRMGPPRNATIATTKNARDAFIVDEITQYQVSGPLQLPSSGKRSIFFTWPAFYESLTHFLPDAKDPTKPAVFDFQDGGMYAVVLESFDDKGAAASFSILASGATPASSQAAPAAALTAVPAAWNGDWAVEARPTRKVLSIHDGKIFLVMGSSETETFPGTTSKQYSFSYAELEVTSLLGGKPYEKYVLSPDGAKLTRTGEEGVTVYVRLAR
jgi:hypothetical protein